jgi:transposase
MPEPSSGAVALHRRHGMVDKTLHEHAPALSEPSQPTRSRSCLSKCAKDYGHFHCLRKRIRSGPFTLRKLTQELAARGIKTDVRAVWTFVHAEGLSFKKNAPAGRTRPPRYRA